MEDPQLWICNNNSHNSNGLSSYQINYSFTNNKIKAVLSIFIVFIKIIVRLWFGKKIVIL